MNSDLRLSVGFWQHQKVSRLEKRLGLKGVRSLQILWCWCAQNRPDGNLQGLDSEEIEFVADWRGRKGAFIEACAGNWLDETEEGYRLHEWADYNPYQAQAGSREEARREKARNAAWFRPDFSEQQMLEAQGAREWLDHVAERMRDCLTGGGFCQAIQAFNLDLLWAGCALLYTQKTENLPLQFTCCQIGAFWVETDRSGQLMAVARRIAFSVSELIIEFGNAKLPASLIAKAEKSPYKTVYVWHLARADGTGEKPVSSHYWLENQVVSRIFRTFFEATPMFGGINSCSAPARSLSATPSGNMSQVQGA